MLSALSIDMYKKEREYKSLTLSDRIVVKNLILHRSRVDSAYDLSIDTNIYVAGDIFKLNEELTALYISLDVTIKLCNFKAKQTKLLDLIFEGYTVQDICSMNVGFKSSATYDLLDRMVDRIAENNNLWKKSMEKQEYIK